MQTRTVEQVTSWESRPFSGGFASLHELNEADFTGAVVAADTWLFMLNGRVVGVFEGSIDDFDSAEGTVYDAPDDSLPLLFSMQERGGSTRAKYFTNDTPIPEADRTLVDANFTGYLELSENVLSGDYYLVYYGGKRMSAAFIGQSERLFSGEEAYDRAAEEVGIYEVKDVSMNITEIPAPKEPGSDQGAVGGAGAGLSSGGAGDSESADPDVAGPDGEVESVVEEAESREGVEPDTGSAEPAGTTAEADPGRDTSDSHADEPGGTTDPSGSSDDPEADPATRPGEEDPDPAGAGAESDRSDEGEAEPGDRTDRSTTEQDESSADSQTGKRNDPSGAEPESGSASPGAAVGSTGAGPSQAERDELERMFQEEEEWRQTRSIPALDPDETEPRDEDDPRRRARRSEAIRTAREVNTPPDRPSGSGGGVSDERVEELREAIDAREEQIEDLKTSMESVQEERSDLEGELEQLKVERDDLEERVSNLESALQRAKDQQAAIDTTATELSPLEALSGTNLFVRYDSKGKPTLDALSSGEVDPEAVNANLSLEYHTEFEDENVVIEGESFEPFLEATSPYRFVSWVVRRLPYELLESGKRSALGDLYEAIPTVDRIEFHGQVHVDAGEGQSTSPEFGVVMRDRMGNPVIVAELNDSRDPVHGEEMADLIESAITVGDVEGSIAGAFYVTASFFEPAALEEAEAAASSGGLFRRSDKDSYVKTANKSGFHLCLVEDRAEAFHVTVPEL